MDEDLIIYPRHLQACHFCLIPGGREWFQQHGFEWRDFVRDGISADKLLATGDGFAQRVVDAARKEKEQ